MIFVFAELSLEAATLHPFLESAFPASTGC